MTRILLVRIVAVVTLSLVVSEGRTMAQDQARKTSAVGSDATHPLSLSLASAYSGDLGFRHSNLFLRQSGPEGTSGGGAKPHDYREISDFFNVREANVKRYNQMLWI